jgi:hypothetical protein
MTLKTYYSSVQGVLYFGYKSQFFQQSSGTPMGSPLSPVFAELFLQRLEKEIILNDPHTIFYRRFVDDTFAIIKSGELQSILQQLNGFHTSIQFPFETEEDSQLPYLDILLHRDEGGRIHRKKPILIGILTTTHIIIILKRFLSWIH